MRTFCDETMVGLPDVAEHQKPDASNAGLERGYSQHECCFTDFQNRTTNVSCRTGSQTTSYFSPKERTMAEKRKHGLSMLKPSSCFYK